MKVAIFKMLWSSFKDYKLSWSTSYYYEYFIKITHMRMSFDNIVENTKKNNIKTEIIFDQVIIIDELIVEY